MGDWVSNRPREPQQSKPPGRRCLEGQAIGHELGLIAGPCGPLLLLEPGLEQDLRVSVVRAVAGRFEPAAETET
jgi:hypothetical protein